MNIVIIEPTGLDGDYYQHALPHHDVREIDSRGWSDAQLIDHIKDAEIVALCNRPLSEQVLTQLPHLKMLAVAFTGTDHIHMPTVNKREIKLVTTAGYANTAVAELVIGLMIALARNIVKDHQNMRYGAVTNSGYELKNKNLAIVGYGAIGKYVGRLARAFGMNILTYDNHTETSLTRLVSRADFVSIHVPLVAGTRHLIDQQVLAAMKSNAYLVNCARGGVVDQQALIRALNQNRIAGAAIDVFDNEPPLSEDHPLFNAKNIILTPHIGFNTHEAISDRAGLNIRNIRQFCYEAGESFITYC